MKITAVILTKNEEQVIEKCIKSVSFCHETIVIDDNSSDKTEMLATSLGAKVYKHPLNNDFSQQRNYALEKVDSDWVLFIDADEIVSENLKEEIQQSVNDETIYDAFYLRRKDYLWGKELTHGETGKTKILRLAKKNSGKWNRAIHEKWIVGGRIGELKNPILHYPHQSLSEFISHVEIYSTIHAKANYDEGKKSNLFKIVFFPILKFKRNYIFRLGFLDGTAGIVHAYLMSLHSFLSWSKLWLQQKELISKRY